MKVKEITIQVSQKVGMPNFGSKEFSLSTTTELNDRDDHKSTPKKIDGQKCIASPILAISCFLTSYFFFMLPKVAM